MAACRRKLEILLESGSCFEAADYLHELNFDSVPEKWEPKSHLEFPKQLRDAIFLWLLIATRLGLYKDLRLLIAKFIAE